MKVNPKFLMMMAALAAGAASAATTTTTAGTVISNTATASYADPSDGTTQTTPSNTVSTTVLPKPDFDVIFDGNTPTDGGTQNAIGTTTKKLLNAVPGQAVDTIYTAINLGNTPLRVNLSADQTGAASGQTVAYFPAGTTSFVAGNAITFVDVAADDPSTTVDEGLTNFIQHVVVASTATPSSTDLYGASPVGRVTGTGTTLAGNGTVTGNGYAAASVNEEEAKTSGTDLQFQAISIFVPNVDNTPNPPVTPPNPVDPGGNPTTPTPPTGPVNVPDLPVGPDPTRDTPPVSPVTPGYTDGTTPIVPNVAGDIQKAYPKADPDNLPDTVTFTNALTNNGGQPDSLQLFPSGAVKSDGTLNTGWTFDATTATFTQNAGLLTEIKVQFLNPDGTAVTVKSGAVYPTLSVPANSTAFYQTKVTYPDPDDSNPVSKVTVSIDVDSTKEALFDPERGGTTTDEIYPAAAQFGDSTAGQGAVSTPAPIEKVTPNGGASGGVTSPADTDSTASFPMDLVNNGQYNDTFILSATTTVPGATVKYFYANGTELSKNTAGDYVSNVVGAGTELKVFAVIDVPAGTATGDYTVSQTATGYFSTIPLTDTNDIIRVTPFGKVGVAKFVAKAPTTAGSDNVTTPSGVVVDNPTNFTATGVTGAKPSDDITYRIIAKNTYNTSVNAFFISDAVPPNTVFKSVALTTAPTSPATPIYKVGAGAWSATAPTAGEVAGTIIYIAVDDDGATGGYAPSPLPSGATLSADFVVTVK